MNDTWAPGPPSPTFAAPAVDHPEAPSPPLAEMMYVPSAGAATVVGVVSVGGQVWVVDAWLHWADSSAGVLTDQLTQP